MGLGIPYQILGVCYRTLRHFLFEKVKPFFPFFTEMQLMQSVTEMVTTMMGTHFV